jgi:hypothetical protein
MTIRSSRFLACTLATTILLLASHERIEAQSASTLETRTTWLPRSMEYTIQGEGITAAHRDAASTRLDHIVRILQQVAEIARPQGFEIRPKYFGGARILRPGDETQLTDVFAYSVILMFFAPTEAIAGEGMPCITVTVNPRLGADGFGMRNDQHHAVYVEPTRGKPAPLATQVYGHYSEDRFDESGIDVLFLSGDAQPWRQVTRDEFYDAVILHHEGKDRSNLADVTSAIRKSPYEEWVEGADQRKREREELLKSLAGVQSAAELAQTRKLMEDQEREVGENLKKSEAEDRAANLKALNLTLTYGDTINAERNAMSPAQRELPALLDTETGLINATGFSVFADRDAPPGVRRVLMPLYDFWRARRSLDEVRAIQVSMLAHLTCSRPAVKAALWQAFRKFDWAAFHRMLAVPRAS